MKHVFASLLSLLWLCPLQAQAMEVTPGIPGTCLATLKGQITPQDATLLNALPLEMPADWTDFEDGSWRAICLDSPGGSLSGGLALARIISENSIGTVVAANAECLSACALLFMFGNTYQHESNSVTNRRLHVLGRLGFHKPDLTLDRNRGYSVDDVEAAFDLAIQSTLEFLTLAARPRPDTTRPFVDADLLEAMLQHEGQNFFEIDTVNKAGRWDVAVFGYDAPPLDEESAFYACQNMTGWQTQLETEQMGFVHQRDDGMVTVRQDEAGFADGLRYDIDFPSMQTYRCALGKRVDWNGRVRVVICGDREHLSSQLGPLFCFDNPVNDFWAEVPGHALLPSQTTLRALAAGIAQIRLPKIGADDRNLCSAERERARVINVQNFASLRQSTGHDTPRVAELPLGQEYTVSRHPTVDPLHPDHAQCFDQCQAVRELRAHDAAFLRACINSNWLWFRIRTPDGAVGYASAKYLDY